MILLVMLLLPIYAISALEPKFIIAFDLNNHSNNEDIKQILSLTEQAVDLYKKTLIDKNDKYPGVTIEGFTGLASDTPKKFCNDEKQEFVFPKPSDFNGNFNSTTTVLQQMRDRLQNMSMTKYSFVIQVSVSTFQFPSTPRSSLSVDQSKKEKVSSALVIFRAVDRLVDQSSQRSARQGARNKIYNLKDAAVVRTFPNDFVDNVKDEMKRMTGGELDLTTAATSSTSNKGSGLTVRPPKAPRTKYGLPLDKVSLKIDGIQAKLILTCVWCCWIVVAIAIVVLILAIIIIICLLCWRIYDDKPVDHLGVQTTERHLDPDGSEPKVKRVAKKVVVVEEEQEWEEVPVEEESQPEPEPKQQPVDAKNQTINVNVVVHAPADKTDKPEKKKKGNKNSEEAKKAPPTPKQKVKKVATKLKEKERHQKSAAQNMSEPLSQEVEIGVSLNSAAFDGGNTKTENAKSTTKNKNRKGSRTNNNYDQVSRHKDYDKY